MSTQGKRVLIVSPSWLGDIIMSQSLLKTLKKLHPGCHIAVYAPEYSHPVLSRMREADEILTNPFAHGALRIGQRRKEGLALKERGFDAAFVLPNSFKSALVPFFAKIRERAGWRGESRFVVLNRMRSDKGAFPRMVERYVALAYVNDPSVRDSKSLPPFEYPSLRVEKVDDSLLDALHIDADRPLLSLGCGANYGPAKMWPVEHFAEVCNYFIDKGGAVLGLGTARDAAAIRAVRELVHPELRERFYDIAGRTDLTQALDLTAMSSLAVCNDSGLMHTAAAAGVPQICIFGSTSTLYTPPLSDRAVCLESDETCHPCFKRTCRLGTYQCLKGIKPGRVILEAEKLLEICGSKTPFAPKNSETPKE